MNFRQLTGAWLYSWILWSGEAFAHEDLDLGVESVTLDRKCRAIITVKNYGHHLPESFYQVVRPAYVVLEKGEHREELKSLRSLDRKRALMPTGGTLTIMSRQTYAHNPKPMDARLLVEGEFLDYGAGNDRVHESMDCVPGQGQVAGETVPDTQPDIAVQTARIDPKTCTLEVVFNNLSSIGLEDTAWDKEKGAFLMRLSLPNHEREPDIALAELDPERQFTRNQASLTFTLPLEKRPVEKWRVGLWRVLDERDFANNQIEITVPESCRIGAI